MGGRTGGSMTAVVGTFYPEGNEKPLLDLQRSDLF